MPPCRRVSRCVRGDPPCRLRSRSRRRRSRRRRSRRRQSLRHRTRRRGDLLLRVVVFVLVIVGASGGALRLPALLETRALEFLLLRLEREVFHLRQVEHAGVLEELGGEVALALAAAARVAVRRLDRLLVVRVRVLVVRGDVVLDTLAEGLPLGRLVVVLAGGRLGELEQAVGAHRVALLHGGAEALQRRLRLAEQRLELHLDLHPHLLDVETLGVELGEGKVHTLRRDAGGQAREERAGRIARRRRSLLAGGEKRRRAGAERAPELVQRVSAGEGAVALCLSGAMSP